MSLATRLGAFFLAALAVVLVGFSATLYLLARSHARRDLDERLTAALDAVAAAAEVEPSWIEWRPGARRPMVGVRPGDEAVPWAVFDGRGRPVDRSGDDVPDGFAAAMRLAPAVGHSYASIAGRDGRRWRLAVRRVLPIREATAGPPPDARGHSSHAEEEPHPSWSHSALVLATGLPTVPLEASLRHIGLILAGVSAGAWLLAAAAGRHLCERALRPVSRMASAAHAMTAADRDRHLPSPGTGDELEDLARSFNGLLDRLHEALERQTRFTGDASHQLRTPLTALLGMVEVARRRDRTAEEYRTVLDQVHDQAVRLRQIVEALLFLARREAEASRPDLEPLDLARCVPLHLRGWAEHARAADLRLDGWDGGPLRVRAHPSLLAQLLDNLLENACKYSDPGTPVRVLLGRGPLGVTLAVEDRGPGLSADERPHVFEPFYRTARVRRLGVPGVGLGLAIVERIAEAFGGSVEVQSEPGLGSRFTLTLPEATDAAAAPGPRPAGAPARPEPAY